MNSRHINVKGAVIFVSLNVVTLDETFDLRFDDLWLGFEVLDLVDRLGNQVVVGNFLPCLHDSHNNSIQDELPLLLHRAVVSLVHVFLLFLPLGGNQVDPYLVTGEFTVEVQLLIQVYFRVLARRLAQDC